MDGATEHHEQTSHKPKTEGGSAATNGFLLTIAPYKAATRMASTDRRDYTRKLAIVLTSLFLSIALVVVVPRLPLLPVFVALVILFCGVHRCTNSRQHNDGSGGERNQADPSQRAESGNNDVEEPSQLASGELPFQMVSAPQKEIFLKANLPSGVVLQSSESELHAVFDERIIVLKEHACPICLVEYEHGETVQSSLAGKCNHVFHGHCIVGWLSGAAKEATCPCCRQPFIPEQLRLKPYQSSSANNPNTSADEEAADSQSNNEMFVSPPNSLFPVYFSLAQRVEHLEDLVEVGVSR